MNILAQRRMQPKKRYNTALWVMVAPAILYFLLFRYAPISGVVIAFQRFSPFRGVLESEWVGWLYFRQFFGSVFLWRVLRNTLVIGFLYLLIAFPMPIILALMLNVVQNRAFKKTAQTITLLPHFVSFVVIAGIAINFLSPSTGVVNRLVAAVGGDPIYFMQEPRYFWWIYTFIRIFKETGYEAIIYLAALTSIDPTLYEAAEADGANKITQLFYITLPSIVPTIVIMFLVRIGRLVSVSFEEVLLLQNDVILETSEVISTFVYRRGLVNADYSYATAVGLFETVVALILVVGSNRIAKRFRDAATLW